MAIFKKENVKKILIVRFGAFGDVLMTFSLLDVLHELFPGAIVDFVIFDNFQPLLAAAPNPPRRVIVLNRTQWPRMNPWRRLLDQLSYVAEVRRERYDLLIDPLSNTRSFFLSMLSRASFRVGIRHGVRKMAYHLAMREGERKYAAEVSLDLLRALGLEVASRRPRMIVPAAEKKYAVDYFRRENLLNKKVVLLQPTGSWPSKVWPAEYFATVARELAARGYQVLLLWGPGEEEDARRVKELSGGNCRLIPEMSILEAAGVIELCSVMVTNDTGPKHMAQALAVPTVCIYGPTWRECWGPGGDKNIEIQKEVECGPCDKTECDDLRCMLRAKPEEIVKAALSLLDKQKSFGIQGR